MTIARQSIYFGGKAMRPKAVADQRCEGARYGTVGSLFESA
jgi:hypothetical protein